MAQCPTECIRIEFLARQRTLPTRGGYLEVIGGIRCFIVILSAVIVSMLGYAENPFSSKPQNQYILNYRMTKGHR